MDFPIPATVTEFDPQSELRNRYSERDEIVLIESGYAENAVFKLWEARQIENQFARLRDYESRVTKLNNAKDNIKSILTNALEEETIEEEVANEVARYLGIDLSRSVNVTVNVSFDITLNVPVGEDVDDVINGLEFDVTSGYSYDAEVEDFDSSISDWNEN